MTNLGRLGVIRLLAFGVPLLILPATFGAQQLPPIAEQMAKTYGLDSFGQIEGIRYTWNAELPGVQISHTWELYVGVDKRVEEMIYRRGGTQKPSLVIATWADHKKAGPLLISTDHRGTADGQPLRISLSDVSVKVTGSENWINAQ